jgi:hypothetical protein
MQRGGLHGDLRGGGAGRAAGVEKGDVNRAKVGVLALDTVHTGLVARRGLLKGLLLVVLVSRRADRATPARPVVEKSGNGSD